MLQMYSSRRVGAVLLVSVLVGGSLLAPLSHLVYMAADGMFAAGHHHPIQMKMDGECLNEAHETHPECPYLTLFAVPLTGDVAELVALPSRDHTAEPLRQALDSPADLSFSRISFGARPTTQRLTLELFISTSGRMDACAFRPVLQRFSRGYPPWQ